MTINQLKLRTPDLQRLERFYADVLGCSVRSQTDDRLAISIGSTVLIFEYDIAATPYHFAINIPANQIEKAAQWLRERVAILPGKDGDIVDFRSWNAKSVYFYDTDKNIVELIARQLIGQQNDQPFSANQFLHISEIGMPVDSILNAYNQISHCAPIPIFSGTFDTFCAIGSDEGLFIIIDKNKKDWFPTRDRAHQANFELSGSEQNRDFSLSFQNGNIICQKKS